MLNFARRRSRAIYDIFLITRLCFDTDEFFRRVIEGEEFHEQCRAPSFMIYAGKYVREREKNSDWENKSLLAVAYEYGVPIYNAAPAIRQSE